MTTTQLVWTLVKIAIMVGFLLNLGGLLTWFDRRFGAMMQDRIGPNRAGIQLGKLNLRVAGLLHTAADGVKFFTKKDFMPPKADKLLFSLAPMLVLIPVLALTAAIPFGDTLVPAVAEKGFRYVVPRQGVADTFEVVHMQVAHLDVGILYVFAMAGQGIVGAAIAGWASDNKFSLMGALRAASQMVSYEVTMGLTVVGAMMIYGTVRLEEMVRWQGENCWGIFAQPLAFVLFFAAATAECKRIPFDLPEAESELVSGYFTEYSGMKFGMFYLSEYLEVVTSSMLLVTIFLGGWELPFIHRDGLTLAFGDTVLAYQKLGHTYLVALSVVTFFAKTIAICVLQCVVRWSLPRFRYDQLMKLGWQVLLPLSLANIFATGVVFLAFQKGGAPVASALKVFCDVTQALVAFTLTALFVWAFVAFGRVRKTTVDIVGTSAAFAQKLGGAKEGKIQGGARAAVNGASS